MADPIRCPHCGQTYAVTPEQAAQYAGQTINCTNCQRPFTVPAAGGAVAPPPLVAGPPGYGAPGFGPGPGPAAGGPYGAAYYAPPGPQKSNGLAIGSLVAGIFGLVVPLLGLVGVILGILGLRRTRDPAVGGKGIAIAGISTGAVGLIVSTCMISVLLPSLNRAREQANRIKCASNLRQIGMASIMYAADHQKQFPPDVQTLLRTSDLTPNVFVCPSTNHTPAPGGGVDQQAQNLATGPHLSYVYVGGGLTTDAPPTAVLAYELPANHAGGRGAGGQVLFADAHVEFLADVQAVADELKAGHNPPRPPGQRGR